jgi:hypothetical protein
MFTYGDPGIGGGGGEVWANGGVFQIPGVNNPTPQSSGGGPTNPSGSWLSQLLPWASLGAQTFLADQAITSPRPATVTLQPNGQFAATGGGALPIAGAVGAIPSWIWIVVVLLVVVMLFKR